VVVLVHHVHREQWPVVYPGLFGRVGWWIESRLAPRVYRHSQYVAVSRATRAELQQLGVTGPRIAVVHNGTDPVVPTRVGKATTPTLCIVGRLVPHKQVEHAIDAVLALRSEFPDIRLHVVGSGWWEATLHEYAEERKALDAVVFDGHVDEQRKSEVFAISWLMALPSLKEGWGLVVGEAGMHHTPTVAYRSAGGTRESITHGRSGLLVDTQREFTEALGDLVRARRGSGPTGREDRQRGRRRGMSRRGASVGGAVLDDRLVHVPGRSTVGTGLRAHDADDRRRGHNASHDQTGNRSHDRSHARSSSGSALTVAHNRPVRDDPSVKVP
jgi:glycosyltransferase involved in cell wall biosynthesis